MKNSIGQTVEGVKYPNLSSIAVAYGLRKNCIYKRYSRGRRGDDLIPKQHRKNFKPALRSKKRVFVVGNQEFKSAAEACRSFDVDYGVYRSRLRQGWSREEALNIVRKTDGRRSKDKAITKTRKRQKPELVVFGKSFPSYKALADFAGLKDYVVWQRINIHGMTAEEAILFDGKKKKVKVGSKEFESKAQFAREADLEPREIYSLLKRHNPRQIVEGEHKITVHTVHYEGKLYNSLTALANAHGLTYGRLKYRLTACDGDLKRALEISDKTRIVESVYGRSAHFYIAEILDESGNETKRYKIGVTQHSLEKRYGEFPFRCRTVFSKDGDLDILRMVEKNIKCNLGPHRVTDYSAADFDGFTEVYELDRRQLNQVKFLAQFNDCVLDNDEDGLPLST